MYANAHHLPVVVFKPRISGRSTACTDAQQSNEHKWFIALCHGCYAAAATFMLAAAPLCARLFPVKAVFWFIGKILTDRISSSSASSARVPQGTLSLVLMAWSMERKQKEEDEPQKHHSTFIILIFLNFAFERPSRTWRFFFLFLFRLQTRWFRVVKECWFWDCLPGWFVFDGWKREHKMLICYKLKGTWVEHRNMNIY